ncbi:CPBP family intramembrane metalloprotease [candidate division WOR-3 bacterium]|nr:CPBP family intramembrane metalloprotease [candidate division WOR-3 bacterium]
MRRVFREYLDELGKIDVETILIIIYSALVLLFAMFMKRTSFILPRDVFIERLLVVGTLYGLAPFVLYITFRHAPKDYGISIGEPKKWFVDVLVFYLIFLVILFIAFKFTNLSNIYPLYRKARHGYSFFFFYQLAQLWYMLGWEFFFRGFMLFGLEKSFGRLTVMVQALAFALAHFRKPQIEAYGAVLAGIILGLLALRSRSFLPCVVLHYMIVLTADILGILT